MCILVFMLQVVSVTGHHNFNIKLFAECENLCVYVALFWAMKFVVWVSVVLNLEIIPIAKNTLVPQCNFFCLCILTFFKCIANFATHTRAECNDALVILLKQIMVNAR